MTGRTEAMRASLREAFLARKNRADWFGLSTVRLGHGFLALRWRDALTGEGARLTTLHVRTEDWIGAIAAALDELATLRRAAKTKTRRAAA